MSHNSPPFWASNNSEVATSVHGGTAVGELTSMQAVRAYEVHPNVLNRLILMGRLKARKNADGRWLISKESLELWNRQRVRRTPRPEEVGATA